MNNRLKRLYEEGQITVIGLQQAVYRGWLTAEEFTEWTGEEYTPPVDPIQSLIDEIIAEVNA